MLGEQCYWANNALLSCNGTTNAVFALQKVVFGPAGAYACGNSDDDTDADASDLAAWAVSFGQAETTLLAAAGSEQSLAAIAIVSPMPATLPALSAELVDAALALARLGGEDDSSETEVVYGLKLQEEVSSGSAGLTETTSATLALATAADLQPNRSAESDESESAWLADKLWDRISDVTWQLQ